jgi:hypothetical protein
VPLPNCEQVLSPQVYKHPVEVIAELKLYPALTCSQFVMEVDSRTGLLRANVLQLPSWPQALNPHAQRDPSVFKAKE